ncbi:MAG: hypothetical protein VW378_00255 [bacterium]
MDILSLFWLNGGLLLSALVAALTWLVFLYCYSFPLVLRRLMLVLLVFFSFSFHALSYFSHILSQEACVQLVSAVLIALAIFYMALLRIQSPALPVSFVFVLSLFFSLLIGCSLWPLWGMLLGSWLLCMLLWRRFSGSLSRSTHYHIVLDFYSPDVLPQLDEIIHSFGLVVLSRDLLRKKKLQLSLTYETTALVQHLFIKRLCSLKGVTYLYKS